jgi:AcrR family transcriptional regulator
MSVVLPGTRTGRDPERSIRRGPRRLPAEVVAATQRDRLLDGIVRTVAQSGYTKARISDICQAAGVTRPVFYEQFEGKEEAFLAAHRHGTTLVVASMEAAFDAAPDWPAGIRDALGTLLGILAEAPAFATMAVVEIDAVGAAGRAQRERLLNGFRRFFAAAGRQAGAPEAGAPETGAPETLPLTELVDAVVGGVHASIYRRIAAGRTAELPELLPSLHYFVLAPFLGPAEAAAWLAEPGPVALGASPPCLVGTRRDHVSDTSSTSDSHKPLDPTTTQG